MNNPNRMKLVVFGNGGDTVYCGRGPEIPLDGGGSYRECRSTISGYGTPERPHAADNVPDGVIALDVRPALEHSEGRKHVFSGPLVDVDLDPGEVDALRGDTINAGFMHPTFKNLLTLHNVTQKTQKRGALDAVSIQEYVEGWVKLGARVGVFKNKKIVWTK